MGQRRMRINGAKFFKQLSNKPKAGGFKLAALAIFKSKS